MYKLKNSLIALVGMHPKKTIRTLLIVLAVAVMMGPMGRAVVMLPTVVAGNPLPADDANTQVALSVLKDRARSYNETFTITTTPREGYGIVRSTGEELILATGPYLY